MEVQAHLRMENQSIPERAYLGRRARIAPGAFTLVDVLVSLVIIAILMGMLLPALSHASESARRVVCQSNVRQIGLAIVMYADDSRGHMPASVFLPANSAQRAGDRPQSMTTLLLPEPERLPNRSAWDGLGLLYEREYLSAAKVFYCPSHTGDYPFAKFQTQWAKEKSEVVSPESFIVANYHYRGAGPSNGVRATPGASYQPLTSILYQIDPAQSSLVSDGMRNIRDYNHKVGVNFFRADLTVHWFADQAGQYRALLPVDEEDYESRLKVESAWDLFDISAADGFTQINP